MDVSLNASRSKLKRLVQKRLAGAFMDAHAGQGRHCDIFVTECCEELSDSVEF